MIQKIWYTQINNQQKKAWTKNLKEILDQANQSIEGNKFEHLNDTITATFDKLAG